jgi:hypothetical protein
MPTGILILLGIAVAVFVGIIVLPMMVLVLRYVYHSRQLQHTERMKAIEVGYPLEAGEASKTQAKYLHNTFWISFWIGFGVPAAAFGAASSAERVIAGNLGLGIAIWVSAAAASMAAVICATVLMIRSRTRPTEECRNNTPKPLP